MHCQLTVWFYYHSLHLIIYSCLLSDCSEYENTPPLIRINRQWQISEAFKIGSKIEQAYSDFNVEPVKFGLQSGNTENGEFAKLPFKIDENNGSIYLQESLKGRAGEHFLFFVTAARGKLVTKSEVLVSILKSSQNDVRIYNTSHLLLNQSKLFYPSSNIISLSGQDMMPAINIKSELKQWSPFIYQKKNGTSSHSISATEFIGMEMKDQLLPPTPNKHETATNKLIVKNVDAINNQTMPFTVPVYSDTLQTRFMVVLIPVLSVCILLLVVSLTVYTVQRVMHASGSKINQNSIPNGVLALNELSCAKPGKLNSSEFEKKYTRAFSTISREEMRFNPQFGAKEIEWEFPRHQLRFLHILGEGAFGQVWKCEAAHLKDEDISLVAVKTLKENATEKERDDLMSELDIMKALGPHVNVVRLLGCCTDKQPLFVIMEYVNGGKLQGYLRHSRTDRLYNNLHEKRQILTSSDLTSFAYQVAKGMEYIASKGIIHRDLAARNILIMVDHVCKVADFGFARSVSKGELYEHKSEGKLPIRWMAPESLFESIYSFESDVWSFGILLWEIVTLSGTPYPTLSADEVIKKIRDGYRLDKPEHCRRELYNIMYYCWNQEPKSRPTFTECANLLEKLLLTETEYIELERFPEHFYYNILNVSEEKL